MPITLSEEGPLERVGSRLQSAVPRALGMHFCYERDEQFVEVFGKVTTDYQSKSSANDTVRPLASNSGHEACVPGVH